MDAQEASPEREDAPFPEGIFALQGNPVLEQYLAGEVLESWHESEQARGLLDLERRLIQTAAPLPTVPALEEVLERYLPRWLATGRVGAGEAIPVRYPAGHLPGARRYALGEVRLHMGGPITQEPDGAVERIAAEYLEREGWILEQRWESGAGVVRFPPERCWVTVEVEEVLRRYLSPE